MNPIHFDIQREILDLRKVVRDRSDRTRQPTPAEELKSIDMQVCVRSRSLFSRFADAALWPGVDEATIKAVRYALRAALNCLNSDKERADEKCLEAVQNRLDAFEEFITNDLPKVVRASPAPLSAISHAD